MTNWRRAGYDTVASRLDLRELRGFQKTAVVQETRETAIVVKNGLVHDVCTGGEMKTLSFVEALKTKIGMGPNLQVYFLDTTPRTLEFWLEDPSIPQDSDTGKLFGMQALTKDGQLVSAQISLTVSIDPENSEWLLRAFHGKPTFTTDDLRVLVKNELLGKVLSPALANNTADELRGNSELLRELYDNVTVQLSNTFRGYGLYLDTSQFVIVWGLNQEDLDKIQSRRRAAEIEQAEHEARLKAIMEPQESIATTEDEGRVGINVGRDLNISSSTGIGGVWLTLIVAGGGLLVIGVLIVSRM